MNDIVAWVFFGFLAVLALIAGLVYAFGSRSGKNTIDNTNTEQDYVLKHIDKFRVKNKGSSLDEDTLYVVDYESIGL